MSKFRIILLFSILGVFIYCSANPEKPAALKIKEQLVTDFIELESATKSLADLAENAQEADLKKAFLHARNSYKKVEWFTEYYAPGTSRYINGAPLPEIEVEETKSFEPAGLQVIEEKLYPFEEENRKELIRETGVLLSKIKHAHSILDEIQFSEAHVIDACKLQIFRIITLGISGFDTPLSKTALSEAKTSLNAIFQTLNFIGNNGKIEALIKDAGRYLDQNSDFETFNRMAFIVQFINPLTRELKYWEKDLKIEPLKTELAIYNKAETLFDKNIFNPDFFADNSEAKYSKEKVELGRELFTDVVLSGNSRTCNSCHKPELAFTDGLEKSAAIIPGTFVKRNAPTLLYAGLQQAQFYDMRSPSLENQAMDVIANKDEMHASVEDAAARMNNADSYIKKFAKAFPSMEKEIKPRYIMIALASYVRSLSPFNSRFDKYMRGEKEQMNAEEIKGFNIFMGKAKCGTCHFMPVFNGTAPPMFINTEAEVLGVPMKPNSNGIDTDSGRYIHNKMDELKFSFKTPTVRNITKTAPYMHNGAYQTLEQVMEFYNEGGGAGLNIELENQTLSPDKLNLSEAEQKAVIAFLATLADRK